MLVHSLVFIAKVCWILVAALWCAGGIFNMVRARPALRRSSDFGLYGVPGAIIVAVIVSLVERAVPAAAWRSISYWNGALALVGTLILVAATVFTIWARWVLGTMWTGRPTIKAEHELRTSGPYGVTRHPIYTGLMGMLFGTMLLAGFGGLLAAFVAAAVFCGFKIRTEERLLTATFGSRYEQYRDRVPAILPLPRHL